MAPVRTVLANVARFILCAVPGAFILLVLPLVLLASRTGTITTDPFKIAGAIAAVPIGAALILYGTNNWGKWGYVLPVVAVLPLVLTPWPVPRIVSIALLLLPFVTAWAVRKYYRRRAQLQHPQLPRDPSLTS